MRFAATLAIIGSMLALAGCNGDGGSDSPGSSGSTGDVQVAGVAVDTLQYSKTASFTVSGSDWIKASACRLRVASRYGRSGGWQRQPAGVHLHRFRQRQMECRNQGQQRRAAV